MTSPLASRCVYGVLGIECGLSATTRRRRPGGIIRWDVCQFHADILDRLQTNMEEHANLLDRLEEN